MSTIIDPRTGRKFGPDSWTPKVAIVTNKTQNKKVGPMAVTHTSQFLACPDRCRFKPRVKTEADGSVSIELRGCYGNSGTQLQATNRVNFSGWSETWQLALQQEIAGIDALPGDRDLRLKVVGDFPNATYAKGIAAAARRYRARARALGREIDVFAFTHAWPDIPVECFDGISIYASCETTAECYQAMALGYHPALVVETYVSPKVYEVDGLKLLPCPHEVGRRAVSRDFRGQILLKNGKTVIDRIQCHECRICLRPDKLRAKGLIVTFEAHSQLREETIARLQEAQASENRRVIPLQTVA